MADNTTAAPAATQPEALRQVFIEAMEWGRYFWAPNINLPEETLRVVSEGFADKAAAMMAAAPAAQEAEPAAGENPPDCNPELYAHGVSVGLFDIPKWAAERLCNGISAATGARVDWHYVGGRVHVKALPAPQAPAAATASTAEGEKTHG